MQTKPIALGALLALSACSQNKVPAGQLNKAASLPTTFNFSMLGLRVLTTFINRRQATTATLYGNDRARQAALGGTGAAQPGEVLALLTWRQQADPNWFGARIPGALQSLELLRTGPGSMGRPAVSYQYFTGKDLTQRADTLGQQARIAYLLAQRPAVLP
ncbi:hypothetical protein FNT36_04130 [Hymenobacter setariae]|uniref:Uncharacterized protein n=1 Tax=Hymenobacter setariae TaxID=2594794 RepID=A0A558C397_9BACT|nr:hypothetical protein [Hymenobacter setariae]TVT43285.1 hypothetical protein FNT36_04130 [Hymenobacter setariae]